MLLGTELLTLIGTLADPDDPDGSAGPAGPDPEALPEPEPLSPRDP